MPYLGINGDEQVQKTDVELEAQRVDAISTRNVDEKVIYGAIARGIWEVAVQLAKLNEKLGGK